MINPPHTPWHAGERALQQSANVLEKMEGIGSRVIRDHLLEQHQEFYPLLPFMVMGTVDAEGDAWATLRAGEPGFANASDAHHLQLNVSPDNTDPAQAGIGQGSAIGLLGIDLQTRRRNRLNGMIAQADERGLDIKVVQSYGNCPRYIHQRQFTFSRPAGQPGSMPAQWMTHLDLQARALIADAATFFVASYVQGEDGQQQIDVSHRGGNPGFVRVNADGSLTIPDYSGNFFFNTLGNLLVNPKSGLTFVDFSTGELLQMTGDARVELDSPHIARFEGAERLWHFTPRHIVRRADALPLRWVSGD